MEKIYSKVTPNKLLHIVTRKSDIVSARHNIVDPDNFIQCSTMKLDKGTTFKPHKHIWKSEEGRVIAQESWIVIQGSVKCTFYDLDDTVIAEPTLYQGDASFTLEGGHNYIIMEDDTLVYEYKTGPYRGQESDKVFLNE